MLPPAANADPPLLASCWSHVRRRYYDLAQSKAAPIAEEILRRIAALYAIEAEIRGQSPPQRLTAHASRSAALVNDLFARFAQQLARLPGRSPTADAVHYALS
ncbi:IS66 family transposase [Roseomonas sp. USHLN139]|uniref:IS66 family transposase n=1 Tax=Roseomonas sp. USHLN139 TaxID=3081298 RepID=UPI003B02B037